MLQVLYLLSLSCERFLDGPFEEVCDFVLDVEVGAFGVLLF